MIIIKKAREVGTSAGVLLPRDWLNKQVAVHLISIDVETITKKVIEILIKRNILNDVVGVYLIGSYARNEEEPDSDIDILVITSNTNKLIKEENYEIFCIAENTLERNLKTNLYIISALKEAKTLINKNMLYIYKGKIKLLESFYKKNLSEIKKVIETNEKIIDSEEREVLNGTIYSLVLRIKELYMLNCLHTGKIFSKNGFLSLLKNEKLYKIYENIKRNSDSREKANINEAKEVLNKLKEIYKKWERRK